jgi:NAD+ diphosphatase
MNSFVRAQRNAFVTHAIDRIHSRRVDAGWFQDLQHDPATRFVVIWQDQVLLDKGPDPHLLQIGGPQVEGLRGLCPDAPVDVVLLGLVDGVTYFGVGIGDSCPSLSDETSHPGHFLDLRGAAMQLDPEEGALAAQAKALVHWHRQHRFCGACGTLTRSEEAGYQRRCTNPGCGLVHFPRVDPAIIVLVTDGDQCLLGRQASWAKGRFSNIAGFVEPGESMETAVAREVWEETGIEIKSLHYHSSQPWPFPQSLMVGFTAEAASVNIRLNDGELEDARWFTRDKIRAGLQQGTLGLPSPYSISFHLIEDWFDAGDCGPLKPWVGSGS